MEYMKTFDLVHSGNYCFTERQLPKIKAAGVPVSFDFSDDSTPEYYEQIAPISFHVPMRLQYRIRWLQIRPLLLNILL